MVLLRTLRRFLAERDVVVEQVTITPHDFAILVDVAAHPDWMPTFEELSYTNPGIEEMEIDGLVYDLQMRGLVQEYRVTSPEDEEYRMVGLTEKGARIWEMIGVETEMLRESFVEQVVTIDMNGRHRELLELPRPEVTEALSVCIPTEERPDSFTERVKQVFS